MIPIYVNLGDIAKGKYDSIFQVLRKKGLIMRSFANL